ncbi:MAG: hypothetical protein ACPLSJ_03440 [Thermosulfidibacteraceae bacterium]|jgi:hypothetical protein
MKPNPNKYYWCILKAGNFEKKSRCIQLGWRELSEEEKKALSKLEIQPTHVINFFDFESRRQIFAKLVEEDETSATFQMAPDKFYTFKEFTLEPAKKQT